VPLSWRNFDPTQARESWRRRLAPLVLRSGLTYSWLRLATRLRPGRFPLRTTQRMATFGLGLTGRAYARGGRNCVWANTFAPTELLYALGLTPFSPEIGAATAASLGLHDWLLQTADSHWYATDGCSFHRCAAGGDLLGLTPVPRALVCTAHVCDGVGKLCADVAERHNRPLYLIDTPSDRGPDAERYLAGRLRDLTERLADATGSRLDQRRLRQAIVNSNDARRYMLQVAELRQARPAPLLGNQALGFLFLVFCAQGSEGAVHVYRRLAEELRQRVAAGYAAVPGERRRLIWLHLRPYYPGNILARLEPETQCVIAFEEMNYVYWDEMDPDRPYESLAKKLMSHITWGDIERRRRAVLRMVEDYGADAVIHFSHWGCRQSCGGVQLLRDALAPRGVPLLSLDGDCIDPTVAPEGPVRTRLEGFLEMLG